jgi:hypothetical protein
MSGDSRWRDVWEFLEWCSANEDNDEVPAREC